MIAPEALVRDVLAATGEAVLTVTGRCLAPALNEGERVVLASPGEAPPSFGDIVLRRVPDGLRLHRVIWAPPLIGTAHWRTRGDDGGLSDPPLGAGDLLAVAVRTEEGRALRSRRRALRSFGSALRARVCGGR